MFFSKSCIFLIKPVHYAVLRTFYPPYFIKKHSINKQIKEYEDKKYILQTN
jgi:hypothetical protein